MVDDSLDREKEPLQYSVIAKPGEASCNGKIQRLRQSLDNHKKQATPCMHTNHIHAHEHSTFYFLHHR